MTQTQITCPGSIVELSWFIPEIEPPLDYDVIIRDQNDNVLLHYSDYQSDSGTLFITAPTIAGNYKYSITVIRDNYGQLSDIDYLFLTVTKLVLTNVYILDNPLLPGEPFTVYWTVNINNPQSDELVQVTINAPPNALGAPTFFQAHYLNDATGSVTFIAPDTVGTFPVTILGVGRFGCSDSQTIMLKTEEAAVDAGSNRTIFAGEHTVLGEGLPNPNTAYTWSPNIGLNTPNGLNPTATPLTTTTYNVIAFRSDLNQYASDQVTIQVINTAAANTSIVVSYYPGIVLLVLLMYFGALVFVLLIAFFPAL